MRYKLGVVVLIATLVSCSENHQGIRVEDLQLVDLRDTNKLLAGSEIVPKINTFRVNQFWESLDIRSITLYVYYPEACLTEQRRAGKTTLKKDNHILNDNMELNKYVLKEYTTELDSIDFGKLKNSIVIGRSFSEGGTAHCFDPHHGFVLKNGVNKIVGHISVCLMCRNYRIYPKA